MIRIRDADAHGIVFVLPLLASVFLLQMTHLLTMKIGNCDRNVRHMSSLDRRKFLRHFWPGLTLLICVYVALTIVRTVRDDFALKSGETWE